MESLGHVLHVFTNGQPSGYLSSTSYHLHSLVGNILFFNFLIDRVLLDILSGSGFGNNDNAKVKLEKIISLVPGKNTIDLLSVTVGLQVFHFIDEFF